MTKLCSAEGCARGILSKGFCNLHYKRMQRNGTLTPLRAAKGSPKTSCPVPDCNRDAVAGGYCIMHYKRQKRNGTTDRVLRKYPPASRCEYCESFGSNGRLIRGLCKACYLRQLKKGYVERDIAPQGSGTITTQGYRMVSTPAGRELEHILVARPKLGEVVHHRDGDKLNNSLDNLQIMSRSDHAKLHAAERKKA